MICGYFTLLLPQAYFTYGQLVIPNIRTQTASCEKLILSRHGLQVHHLIISHTLDKYLKIPSTLHITFAQIGSSILVESNLIQATGSYDCDGIALKFTGIDTGSLYFDYRNWTVQSKALQLDKQIARIDLQHVPFRIPISGIMHLKRSHDKILVDAPTFSVLNEICPILGYYNRNKSVFTAVNHKITIIDNDLVYIEGNINAKLHLSAKEIEYLTYKQFQIKGSVFDHLSLLGSYKHTRFRVFGSIDNFRILVTDLRRTPLSYSYQIDSAAKYSMHDIANDVEYKHGAMSDADIFLPMTYGVIKVKIHDQQCFIDCQDFGFNIPGNAGYKKPQDQCEAIINLATMTGSIIAPKYLTMDLKCTDRCLQASAHVFTDSIQGRFLLQYNLHTLNIIGTAQKVVADPFVKPYDGAGTPIQANILIDNLHFRQGIVDNCRVLYKDKNLTIHTLDTARSKRAHITDFHLALTPKKITIRSTEAEKLSQALKVDMPILKGNVLIDGQIDTGVFTGSCIATNVETIGTGPLAIINIISPANIIRTFINNPIRWLSKWSQIRSNKWPEFKAQWEFKPGNYFKLLHVIGENDYWHFMCKGDVNFMHNTLDFTGLIGRKGLIKQLLHSKKQGVRFTVQGDIDHPQTKLYKTKSTVLWSFIQV